MLSQVYKLGGASFWDKQKYEEPQIRSKTYG